MLKTDVMHRVLALATLCLFGGYGPARGTLVTDLAVTLTPQGGGTTLYEYTLTNLASSDIAVVSFALSIPADADLMSIAGPAGWVATHTMGDLAVSWESSDAVFDLLPGASTVLSFESPLGPALRDYLIVGLDEVSPRIEFNEGQIAGPGASAVPEPSTLALMVSGTAVLGVAWIRRKRGCLRCCRATD